MLISLMPLVEQRKMKQHPHRKPAAKKTFSCSKEKTHELIALSQCFWSNDCANWRNSSLLEGNTSWWFIRIDIDIPSKFILLIGYKERKEYILLVIMKTALYLQASAIRISKKMEISDEECVWFSAAGYRANSKEKDAFSCIKVTSKQ